MNCTIWEAGRATSAAPSFFDPVTIGQYGQQFVDGATGCNNPVRQVLSEARSIWTNADDRIQCLISIGTGQARMTGFGENLQDVARSILRIATETELTAENFMKDHSHVGLSGRYHRFNVARGLEMVALEDYAAKPIIASATMAYLNGHEIARQLEICASLLRLESPRQSTKCKVSYKRT